MKVGHQVCHIDQLLRTEANSEIPRSTSPIDTTTFPVDNSIGPQEVSDNHNADPEVNPPISADTPTTPEEPRYPQRQRRAPDRFTPNA